MDSFLQRQVSVVLRKVYFRLWYKYVDGAVVGRMTADLVAERKLLVVQAAAFLKRWLKRRRERQSLERRIQARNEGRQRRLQDIQEQSRRLERMLQQAHPHNQLWRYTGTARTRVSLWIDKHHERLCIKSLMRSSSARSTASQALRAAKKQGAEEGSGGATPVLHSEYTEVVLDSIVGIYWGMQSPLLRNIAQRRHRQRLHSNDAPYHCFAVKLQQVGDTSNGPRWLNFAARCVAAVIGSLKLSPRVALYRA